MKERMTVKNKDYKIDIVPGIVLALFSIYYLVNVPGISEFSGLGSTPLTNRFVPYLWGSVMLILSIWIIVRGLRRRKRYLAEGGTVQKVDLIGVLKEKREVIASFALLIAYVALMSPLGFVPSTIIYVFCQILVLTPTSAWKKTFLPAAIVAIVSGILLFYVFRYMLNVLLPIGILSAFGL